MITRATGITNGGDVVVEVCEEVVVLIGGRGEIIQRYDHGDVWKCPERDTGYDAECTAAAASEGPVEVSVLVFVRNDMRPLREMKLLVRINRNLLNDHCLKVLKKQAKQSLTWDLGVSTTYIRNNNPKLQRIIAAHSLPRPKC